MTKDFRNTQSMYSMLPDKWIIFDLDGTLADISDRRRLASKENGKINWSIFFDPKNIPMDKPIPAAIELLSSLQEKYNIAIFTGRGAETVEATEAWLAHNGIHYDLLKMRPVQDYVPDDDLKKDWLNTEFPDKSKVLCVFDDRDKVVSMWRNEGLLCCQVAQGDF
jgi:hypothetical protein